MITKDNIEAYLLDFLEGNLKSNELLELEFFLKENPSYSPDFELVKLEKDNLSNFDKSTLKKNLVFEPVVFQEISEGTAEEKMHVAATENVLSEAENVHFNNYLIDNLDAQKEFLIYQNTRFETDHSIVFPNIRRLKRKEGKVFVFSSMTKWSAAAIVIGIGIWLLFGTNLMQRNFVTKKTPNLRKETLNPQVEKPNVSATNYDSIDNFIFLHPQFNSQTLAQQKDSLIEQKETFSVPIDMATEMNVLDTNAAETYKDKNETLHTNELAKISTKATNTLTPLEFVNSKLKKRFFGKNNPSKVEMYASLSNRISSVIGIPFLFLRKQEKENRSFYFRFGIFSIEKN